MSSQTDYYEVLEIGRSASAEEIKKAYHRQAIKYHPDKNPGDQAAEEHFKAVSEAYQVLSDPQKKAHYDRFGHEGVQGGFGAGGADFDPMEIFREFARRNSAWGGGLEDLFSGFMGGFESRRGRGHARRGEDLALNLALSLEEIARGVEKKVRLKRMISCPECGGNGAGQGGQSIRCSQCDGSGEIKVVQRALWGQVVHSVPCSRCGGEGRIIENPCSRCAGEGRIEGIEEILIKIPAGV
ncbi:MAG: DnaJ domain-containing protein, partial [Candidatus Eisenbacteria sp.]|nr:DnaJ domain-containing protein [Candidatus Eisenbacteria bacterium]